MKPSPVTRCWRRRWHCYWPPCSQVMALSLAVSRRFTIAFSFTYVGHLVEALLLKIPGHRDSGRQQIVRVLGWFAGGLCVTCSHAGRCPLRRDTRELRPCCGVDCFFVGLEFVVHALLQPPASPTFTSGGVAGEETTAVR